MRYVNNAGQIALLLLFSFCGLILSAQPTVNLLTPANQAQFTAPATVTIEAAVLAPPNNGANTYLQITNPSGGGWRKLKLGYSDNIWYPAQNVTAGGNTHLLVTFKDLTGAAQWQKLEIRPQSQTATPSVNFGDYINSAQNLPDGWKQISIPLTAFSGVNFSAITYIEIPYSVNAAPFELGIKEIRFTGGSAPFEWFGQNHFNNAHDGQTLDGGNLLAALQTGNSGSSYTINHVAFYQNNNLLGQANTAPYAYTWNNAPEGNYALTATVVFNDTLQNTSPGVNITITASTENEQEEENPDNPPTTAPPAVALTHPQNNAQVAQGSSIDLTAQAGFAGDTYLQIDNPDWGWLKLKLGYHPNNLWSPQINVLTGGNTTMQVTLKDFNGNANWSKLQIRPQGVGANPIAIANYLANAENLPDGWKKISIPIADFYNGTAIFQSISYIEIPYSVNVGAFNIAIKEIKFTGGSNPFLWFGEGKTDNMHDGNTGWGALPAQLITGGLTTSGITKVAFFANDTLLTETTQAPYHAEFVFDQPGNYTLMSRAFYNNNNSYADSPPCVLTVTPLPDVSDTISIRVTFDAPPQNIQVNKAPLKYNKDFAYSLTLDDGLADAYTVAYPIFNGGSIGNDNFSYSSDGLYYTDGCGHKIPFRAGIAINALNAAGQDVHNGSISDYLTWEQVDELYASGWDIFNHSLSHQAGWVGAPLPDSVYVNQVVQNNNYVRTHTANQIEMTHFVVPSGDANYYQHAFNNGMQAVYNQFWLPNFQYGLNTDEPQQLNQFLLNRSFMPDSSDALIDQINAVAAQSLNTGNHYWWNDFTHNCGSFYSPVGGGLQLYHFANYMEHIANNYGVAGNDNAWAASLQEVYEYLAVKQSTTIGWELTDNQLTIQLLLTNLPANLRRHALTLLINTDQNFNNIEVLQGNNLYYSFNGNANQQQLINLEWGSFISSPEMMSQKNATQPPPIEPTVSIAGKVRLVPNPTAQDVWVQFTQPVAEDIALTLFNQLGQCVLQQTQTMHHQNRLLLPTEHLPKGIYYLHTTTATQTYDVVKLVKE